jgi:ABC-type phosphate/phosphonate transport system, permease component
MTTSSLPPHLIEIENQLNALARTRMIYTLIFIAAIVILTVTGVTMAEARNAGSFSRGIDNFFDYPVDLFVEAFETGWAWWGLLLKHLPELMNTINLALFSTFLGFVFAVVLSLVASKNLIQNGFWVAVARRSLDIMRSFPELVIAMIFLYLMGKSELPALIAIWDPHRWGARKIIL